MSTLSHTSPLVRDFEQQLKSPGWPRILVKETGREGTILRGPKDASLADCEAALDQLQRRGVIERREHFLRESNGRTHLFVVLRPIRSGSPQARKQEG